MGDVDAAITKPRRAEKMKRALTKKMSTRNWIAQFNTLRTRLRLPANPC